MSAIAGALPRVSIVAGASSAGLAAGLEAALEMLSQARRLVLVGHDEHPDIVHTVGAADLPERCTARRVHAVDRIELRDGRLVPTGWWVRRERRHVRGATAWLAHGQTAGRLLVDAGLAPGERVHCLPLVAPPGSAAVRTRDGARTAVRERLGLPPGVRLVIGVAPLGASRPADRWGAALLGARRPDVTVARIRVAADTAAGYRVGSAGDGWPRDALPLAELLVAADLFIAADHALEAYTPAAAAVACGIPVIAVTTDSVAELVLSGAPGFVVPARADRIAQAALAQLDSGATARHARVAAPDESRRLAELAHGLLAAYRCVLSTSRAGSAA